MSKQWSCATLGEGFQAVLADTYSNHDLLIREQQLLREIEAPGPHKSHSPYKSNFHFSGFSSCTYLNEGGWVSQCLPAIYSEDVSHYIHVEHITSARNLPHPTFRRGSGSPGCNPLASTAAAATAPAATAPGVQGTLDC